MQKVELMEEETDQDTSQAADGQLDDSTANGVSEGLDTTQAFHSVFQGQTQFSSWEEFIQPFEEFQLLTNSVFKPKSSVCVNWINEKRTTEKIPEKFVYSKVNMICQHFGVGVRKQGSTRKQESYVGQDCEAFVKLSYKKGFLNITKYNLVHTNHSLNKTDVQSQMRRIRPVIFNDDLDLLICKVAEECNVFETRTSETNWQTAVTQLPKMDSRLEHITRRMLKKRLQFLMDRFSANCEGSEPLDDDEMGIILHRLLQQKIKVMSPSSSKRGRKKKHASDTPRPRGRPRKFEDFFDGGGLDDLDNAIDNTFECIDSSSSSSPQKSLTNTEITSFLNYWTKRDADERKMRWEEMKLRKEELELQKSKFELEQKERLTLLELLKTQGQIVNSLRKSAGHVVPPAPTKGVTKEFILNKDGSLQPVVAEHEEPNKTTTVMSVHTQNLTQQHSGNMTAHNPPMSVHNATMQQVHTHTANLQVQHVAAMPGHGHTAQLTTHPTGTMTTHPHSAMPQHSHGQAMQGHTHTGMPAHGGMGGHLQGHH